MSAATAFPPRAWDEVRDVAIKRGVSLCEILSHSHAARVVVVRDEAIRRCRALRFDGKPLSYPRLGAMFGMHHTAIMDACGTRGARGGRVCPRAATA